MTAAINLTLDEARLELKNRATARAFVDKLPSLSPASSAVLAPIIIDFFLLTDKRLANKALASAVSAHPEWINYQDGMGNTPLMLAVSTNNLDAIDILLAGGAQTHQRKDGGFGALDLAAFLDANHRHQSALVHALLENGKFTQEQKDLALHHAAGHGNAAMVRALIGYGAKLGAMIDGQSALMAACLHPGSKSSAAEVVSTLLSLDGARQIMDDGWGEQDYGAPLHTAVRTDKPHVARLLIDAGALVNPPTGMTTRPDTPLMKAAAGRSPESVKLLLSCGADVTLTDAGGNNALHHATCCVMVGNTPAKTNRTLECIDLLAAAGVDPTAINDRGQMPVDMAIHRQQPQGVIERLIALSSAHQMNAKTSVSPQPCTPAGPRL